MAAECPVLDTVDHAEAGSDDNGRVGHVAGAPFDERGGLLGAEQPVRITTVAAADVDATPMMTMANSSNDMGVERHGRRST